MVVNENNPKIWASLTAPNPDDVTYWVDLTADPHGNIIKFYDENDEKWYNLTSPTSDYAVYPYIGPNGNWFIENKDSGVSASGEIPDATINGYHISENPVLTKEDIGLGNVANLAPEDYPVPDAVYGLIDGKVDKTRTINGYTLGADVVITKSDIGLGNVENVAPADMPISTATATALSGKADTTRNIVAGSGLVGGGSLAADRTFNVASANDGIIVNVDNIQLNTVDNLSSTSVTQPLSANQGKILNETKVPTSRTVNGYSLSSNVSLTKSDIGLSNVANLAPADLPISTATQTALNSKVNTSRQVIAGSGLTGGGALTSDLTLNVVSGNDGISASADAITLNTVNNLISTSTTQPLSAAQGKALQDSKINNNGTNSNIDVLHFNPTTLTALSNIGDVRFSDESKTLEVKVSDTVSIQLGQETQARVKNNAGVQINNGQVVYIESAAGANPLAKLATTADQDIAQRTFGMATENIAINGFGAITTEGLVRDVNTSAFAEGAMLWLSTNGSITTTEPVAPTPKVSVGMVLRSNATNGVIYVKIRAIARNSKLSDVYAPTLANGNILRWNSATSRFEVWDSITSLANKVDVVAGKGLSTNDYTTTEKNKLAGIATGANNYTHPSTHSADILVDGTTNKVFTATEKTKLSGIATGAEVNVQSDWNAISGDALILNKPTTISGYGITDAYTKTEVDNKLSAVYKYKGIVPTVGNLPSTGMVVGDVWNVTDTNINYAWDGSVWDPLGGVVGADVSLATPTTDGLLSASDFVKLSGIESNANNYTHPATHSADIIVDGTTNKVYTATEKTKLAGIATGAEVNVNPDWNAASGDAQILNKPTTISGYGITDAYTKTQVDTSLSGKEPTIAAGTTAQYWRGDKSWQALNKAAVGLSSVENTALSTWVGSTNISTVGTITNGTWSGSTIGISKGGTNLTALGTANQLLRVNSGASALEYFTPTWTSNTGTVTSVSMTVPTGLTVTGSPVTTAGTFAVTLTSGYSIPTTVKQGQWDTAYGWGNHSGLYQPIDADLTSIAGLAGTSGLLKKTAADTWTLDTSTYLTGNQTIILSGAVTGSGTTAITTSYADTVPTTKGGTGLTSIGTQYQYLAVKAGGLGLEWVTSRDRLSNQVTTLESIPTTKRLVLASITAETPFSLSGTLSSGDILHIVIYNTTASPITQNIPNYLPYLCLNGTSITIPAYGYAEINILTIYREQTIYLIRTI